MAKWRYFAERQLPKVIRDLGLPAALPPRDRALKACPLHRERLGKTTRMCESCHRACWDEIGRRYAAQGRPVKTEPQPERKENSMTSNELAAREPEIADAEIVTTPAPLNLFGTTDPDLALQRMGKAASALVDVIRDRGLVVKIGGREHLTAEAWTTLGGMLGVVPVVAWTRPLDDGGWEARVEARTLDGRVVGAAESMCTRSEQTWRTRDEFALRSMAQTRAIGRALRGPLGQIVKLAGYDPTGAEEMPADSGAAPAPRVYGLPEQVKATPEQLAGIAALIDELTAAAPSTDWKARCRELISVPRDQMTRGVAEHLIDQLEDKLEELAVAKGADE